MGFFIGVAGWLFHVNVLACLAGPEGLRRVPVIWGRNQDRLDVFTLQQLLKARCQKWLPAETFPGRCRCPLQMLRIHIAEGHQFHFRAIQRTQFLASRLHQCHHLTLQRSAATAGANDRHPYRASLRRTSCQPHADGPHRHGFDKSSTTVMFLLHVGSLLFCRFEMSLAMVERRPTLNFKS
ncbi:MAG: hypothetical protein RL648_1371 [Verrucomicrobiota bacterium]